MACPATHILAPPQEGQRGGLSLRAPPPVDRVTVVPTLCTVTAWCSSQSKRLSCAQGFPARCPAPARAPPSPRPRPRPRPAGPSSAAACPLPKPGPASCSPLPSGPVCPQSAKWPQEPCRRALLFHSGRCRKTKKKNTSVNLMFLGCLIKRDKIAEELGAGLAGVGSHALPPQAAASG